MEELLDPAITTAPITGLPNGSLTVPFTVVFCAFTIAQKANITTESRVKRIKEFDLYIFEENSALIWSATMADVVINTNIQIILIILREENLIFCS